jgi:Na+-translocating ferredoxin:NAD+ oxidoreductase subunit D
MSKILTVTPSPHIHQGDSVNKIMRRVIFALIPALVWSFVVFGMASIVVTLTAVVACMGFEYAIQKWLLKKEPTLNDGSAILTGILLAMNVPSTLPWWIVVIGALVAIGVGKMSFGGLGQNPFNPALVGRVFLLIAYPVQMTNWPTNLRAVDATSGATPLAFIKESVKSGKSIADIADQIPTYFDMLLGYTSGSMGEISAILLLIGFAYMLFTKVIRWHIPVFTLGTIFIFAGILWLANPNQFIDPIFHLLTGGAMLGAIYMATDMVTSPMTVKGQLIFGLGIGVLTVAIRTWGAYPEGISFAILIMNAFTPLINNYFKPKRFGGVK